jgi:predicted dehydrogenase
VDIATPNNEHAVMAIEAARQGKHILCEKPLAMNLAQAKAMLAAARNARVKTMVGYNYRYCPAIQLARQLVTEGKIGRIYHVRASFLQSWIINPDFPFVWRLDAKVAGSGSHGDLNAHILDATRFVTGDEPIEVCAHMETFIKDRPAGGVMGGGLNATGAKARKRARVTVDDAVIALARFSKGAVATYEATRFAAGHRNDLGFEVNGSKGSVKFVFERMNELKVYLESDPGHIQGFRNVQVTESGAHKYIDAWWPAGHVIGYEHTFVHQALEFLKGIKENRPLSPDFLDSTRNQAVLSAMSESARRHRWVRVARIS